MTRTTRVAIALLDVIDLAISPEQWPISVVIGFAATIAVVAGIHDIHQVVTGTVNMNRWWPGVIPAAMAAFIAIVRIIDRAGRAGSSSAEDAD